MAGSKNTEAPGAPATPSAAELEDRLFKEAYLDMQAEARREPHPVGPMQSTYPKEYGGAREMVVGTLAFAVSGAVAIQRAKKLAKMLDDKNEGATAIGGMVSQPASEFMRGVMLTHLLRLTKGKPRQGKSKAPDNVVLNEWERTKACLPNAGIEERLRKACLKLPISRNTLRAQLKRLGQL